MPLTLLNGSGNIEFSGSQTMGANTLVTAATTSGNIQLDSGVSISSTAAGYNITLAASGGDFINNSTLSSPLSSGGGNCQQYTPPLPVNRRYRWQPVMNPTTTRTGTAYPTTTGESGNTWFYSSGIGTITITGMTASDKPYDGTTTATINNAADTLNGIVSGISLCMRR